jgi:hypothetical protein
MFSLRSIGGALKGRWGRGIGGALTLLILSAVPAVGFSRLGVDLTSFWDSPPVSGPLTFNAPTSTRVRLEARVKEARTAVPADTALLLGDWTETALSTATTPAQFEQQTMELYFFEFLLNSVAINQLSQQQFDNLLLWEIIYNICWFKNRPNFSTSASPST